MEIFLSPLKANNQIYISHLMETDKNYLVIINYDFDIINLLLFALNSKLVLMSSSSTMQPGIV